MDRLVAAIEAQLAGWNTLLSSVQLALVGLAIAAAVAFLYASHLLVFAPVDRLRQRPERRWSAATFAMRVVAEGAQRRVWRPGTTASTAWPPALQALYAGHGRRRERNKTSELREEKHRLAALYDASAFAARAASQQELAAGFTDRLAARGPRCDAVAIRWLDTSQQRMVLLAAQGLPPALLEAERCLKPGDCHCGAPELKARVIHIHSRSRAAQSRAARKAGFVAITSVALPVQGRSDGRDRRCSTATPRQVEQ
jgi:two-component system nitrate/nitrite sensor histidine kinase NarX